MFTQLNQYHVVLEVDPQFRPDPDSLKNIYVPMAATGNRCPLSARPLRDRPGPLTINHQGQFPAVTISFNLGNGASLGER